MCRLKNCLGCIKLELFGLLVGVMYVITIPAASSYLLAIINDPQWLREENEKGLNTTSFAKELNPTSFRQGKFLIDGK